MQIHPIRRAVPVAIALAAALGLAAIGTIHASTNPSTNLVTTAADTQPGEDEDDVATTASTSEHRRILIVRYHVVKDCKIHANYPSNPGDHAWVIKKGATISWRYNVTSKIAAVSDPARTKSFPHWGFVEDSSCIGASTGQESTYRGKPISFPAGRPMPQRILSGRSQFEPFWRAVDWHPDHGAIPAAQHKLGHDRTLRDAPHRFVIGNVYAAWQVRPTSAHQDGYTLVYVPSLKRWGWLQL